MTKREIGDKLAENLTGLTKGEAVVIVGEVIDIIRESLVNGESVYLRGFGTFSVSRRKARTARNIMENKVCVVPERCVPIFKPCKPFKEEVNDANN